VARSPCIGICSTTYGDLVCRGCKRFAHEVVGWNGYDDDQKGAIWLRLRQLQSGATLEIIELVDGTAFARQVEFDPDARASVAASEPGLMIYQLLRRWARSGRPLAGDLARLGLRIRREDLPRQADSLLRCIDQEFYLRSLAVYEHSFRRPAR
jgi:hypothetical protein